MTEVPRAQVENAPRPLHTRPGVRKLAGVVVAVAACYGGWRLLKYATRSEESKKLEARQDKARKQIGSGLDKLFDAQLDEDTRTVELVATFDVDGDLENHYDDSDCAKGLQAAFTDALGPDVVDVSTFSSHSSSDLRMTISGKITPSGHSFQLPNSRTAYPGIKLAADMTLIGKKVHADVQPASDLEFEYTRFAYSMEGISASDVAGGLLQDTCKQAGYTLLEHLTKWKRPAPPPPPDPMKDCERGFHCRENADEIADHDPATAEKLYAKACEHEDEDACVALANLVMRSPAATDRALASVTLEMSCQQEVAAACAAGAQIALLPLEAGKPTDDWQRKNALVLALRACDLGAHDACELAAPLVKGTPYAEAAPLLTGAKTVATKRMGTMFALRWGQWTKMDRGQPTMWFTRRPAAVPEGAIVRELGGDKIPHGITPPAGVETVYAVALDGGHGGYDEECNHCMPSGGGDSIYSMRSFDCVCALTPH